MKNSLILLLISGLMLPLSAAGKPVPTVQASCSVCSTTEDIAYTGTGYKVGTAVILDIEGPNAYSVSITTTADKNGNLYATAGASYAVGFYTVTATVKGTKGSSIVAGDYFNVE